MSEFINTIDLLGDDAVIDNIINRTITEFKDDKITSVGAYAFYKCADLTTVDLPNVTNLGMNVFAYCTSLVSVNLPKATAIPGYAFLGCTALVDYPDMSKITSVGTQALDGTQIASVYLPLVTALNGSLRGMTKLTTADLPICTKIGGYTFYTDLSLKAVILRSSTLCTLDNKSAFTGAQTANYTPIAKGEGYIYVPSALIDSYKAATNWSTYADQFRALEDYTVDGTTTGELDETKI